MTIHKIKTNKKVKVNKDQLYDTLHYVYERPKFSSYPKYVLNGSHGYYSLSGLYIYIHKSLEILNTMIVACMRYLD